MYIATLQVKQPYLHYRTQHPKFYTKFNCIEKIIQKIIQKIVQLFLV
jgi:hypothetical protein